MSTIFSEEGNLVTGTLEFHPEKVRPDLSENDLRELSEEVSREFQVLITQLVKALNAYVQAGPLYPILTDRHAEAVKEAISANRTIIFRFLHGDDPQEIFRDYWEQKSGKAPETAYDDYLNDLPLDKL